MDLILWYRDFQLRHLQDLPPGCGQRVAEVADVPNDYFTTLPEDPLGPWMLCTCK